MARIKPSEVKAILQAKTGMPEFKRGTQESAALSAMLENIRTTERASKIVERAEKLGSWKLALNEDIEKARSEKPSTFALSDAERYQYQQKLLSERYQETKKGFSNTNKIEQPGRAKAVKQAQRKYTKALQGHLDKDELQRARSKAKTTGGLKEIRETVDGVTREHYSRALKSQAVLFTKEDTKTMHDINKKFTQEVIKNQEALTGKMTGKQKKQLIENNLEASPGFIAVVKMKTENKTKSEVVKEMRALINFDEVEALILHATR